MALPRTTDTTTNGHHGRNCKPTSRAASTTGNSHASNSDTTIAGSLSQAVALRDTLRSTAKPVSELVRALTSEKRQSRIVRSTLASLRSLEAIDA